MGKEMLALKICGLFALLQVWGVVWGVRILLNSLAFADAAVNLFEFYRIWRGV